MAAIAQTPAAGKGKVRTKKRSTFIDMTPMVDLAFLLLTFFILTTTITKPYVVELTMPEKQDTHRFQPIKAEQALTVVLGANNKVYWYQGVDNSSMAATDFSSTGIRKILREKNAAIKKMYIVIKPSDKSRYQNTIDILDEMVIGEYKYYSIAKITPEDEALIRL